MEKVLLTGASSGIGKDIAKILSKEVKKIFLLARSVEKLKNLKYELEERHKNLKCEIIQYDLSNIKDLDKIIEKCDVDTVINCAGFGKLTNFFNISTEEELATINVNFIAPMLITRKFLDIFKKNNKGLIVNICSTAALHYHPYMAIYSSTKAGLLHYSLALDEELRVNKKNKTRVLSICPGPTATDFFDNSIKEKFGSSQNFMMSSEKVANEIVRSIKKKKSFSIVGYRNRVSMFLINLFPITIQLRILSSVLKRVLK